MKGAILMFADKRINHRFTKLETSEPEFDTVLMIVSPEDRRIYRNKDARNDANVILLVPPSEHR